MTVLFYSSSSPSISTQHSEFSRPNIVLLHHRYQTSTVTPSFSWGRVERGVWTLQVPHTLLFSKERFPLYPSQGSRYGTKSIVFRASPSVVDWLKPLPQWFPSPGRKPSLSVHSDPVLTPVHVVIVLMPLRWHLSTPTMTEQFWPTQLHVTSRWYTSFLNRTKIPWNDPLHRYRPIVSNM